jgi:hypothetical protein
LSGLVTSSGITLFLFVKVEAVVKSSKNFSFLIRLLHVVRPRKVPKITELSFPSTLPYDVAGLDMFGTASKFVVSS